MTTAIKCTDIATLKVTIDRMARQSSETAAAIMKAADAAFAAGTGNDSDRAARTMDSIYDLAQKSGAEIKAAAEGVGCEDTDAFFKVSEGVRGAVSSRQGAVNLVDLYYQGAAGKIMSTAAAMKLTIEAGETGHVGPRLDDALKAIFQMVRDLDVQVNETVDVDFDADKRLVD